MALPTPLSSLCDPVNLAKVQVLLVPVQPSNTSVGPRLSDAVYSYWSGLIKRHQSIRSDEIRCSDPSSSSSSSSHVRGTSSGGPGPSQPRNRFLPAVASSSTSVSRANTSQHVQLAFPPQPPARHLYPLNLLRMAEFPLVVIGIAVNPGGTGGKGGADGYSLTEEDEEGDMGVGGSTPIVSGTRQPNGTASTSTSTPSQAFEDRLSALFPPSSAFPLVKRLVVVPQDVPKSPNPNGSPRKGGRDDARRDKGKDKEDVRYAPEEGADVWVGALLGEVIADLLGELGELVTALETPTGLKTLSSTLLPSLTSTSAHLPRPDLFPVRTTTPGEMPSRPGSSTPTLTHSQSVDALSTGSMGITLHRALTPGGRPTSTQSSAINPIAPSVADIKAASASNPTRRFSAIPSPFTRTPSAPSVAAGTTAGGAQSPAIATKYTSAPLAGVAGGRLLKILGDVHLLVGAYADAIKCYDDGAERCRVAGDVLWEAVAREGRAVAGLGEAWETRDGSDRSQPFSSSPIPVEIVAHYLSALSCLSRAPLPYPPTVLAPLPQTPHQSLSLAPNSLTSHRPHGSGEGLLAHLYISLNLRIAHFHFIIWASGGWGSIALSCLVSHTLPRTFPLPLDEAAQKDPYARRRRHRFFALLSVRSGLTRTSIFGQGETAVGPPSRALPRAEQMAALTEVVWLARWLDLPRHEAIYGWEVVRRLGGLMLERREEARTAAREEEARHESRRTNSKGLLVNGEVGLGLGVAASAATVIPRRRDPAAHNPATIVLIERILAILNINLLPPLSTPMAAPRRPTVGEDDAIPARFGWPEVQVDTLQSLVHVADNLADQELLIRLALSALKGLGAYLHQGSQAHLLRLINGATATLKRRGKWRGGVEWWIPGKMVLSLEVAALPANRLPVEHAASEIAVESRKEPFLYNPRVKSVEAGKTVIVANEQVDIFVTLSNPFAFDLEVADLSLITSGVQFLANPFPLVLPANSVQTVRLTGTAPEAGDLYIQGVSLRLPDGASTKVFLPVVNDKARLRKEKRRSRALAEVGKMKRSGTDARLSTISHEADNAGETNQVNGQGKGAYEYRERTLAEGETWLLCRVVRELPLLWVKRSNLTHGTVMLYDGERTILRLTLENSSSTPVNILKLSFDDNTLREGRAVLNEELPPDQVYEIEWDMIKRPVFSWDGAEAEVNIPPNGRFTVSISCLGKVGCTEGSIRLDYGFIERDESQTPPSFHTRHITFPVLFTVYHGLEVHNLDIVGFNRAVSTFKSGSEVALGSGSEGADAEANTVDSESRLAPLGQAGGDHCLVLMSVRNVYGVPFEVSLARRSSSLVEGQELGEVEEGTQWYPSTRRMIPPGASERLILPVPRFSLASTSTSLPIPSLTSRQYIIDKSGRSAQQHQADLELFWYRQHLLSCLRLQWVEGGTKRQGGLSLRTQRLTAHMLDALRVDQVRVAVLVNGQEEGEARVDAADFVRLEIKVTNRLERPLRCQVRLEPVQSAEQTKRLSYPPPAQHVVFDGMLSATMSDVQPNQSRLHSLAALFLAEGSFAFRAIALEMPDDTAAAGGAESRVWYSDIASVHVG